MIHDSAGYHVYTFNVRVFGGFVRGAFDDQLYTVSRQKHALLLRLLSEHRSHKQINTSYSFD